MAKQAGLEDDMEQRSRQSGWYSIQTLYTACFLQGRIRKTETPMKGKAQLRKLEASVQNTPSHWVACRRVNRILLRLDSPKESPKPVDLANGIQSIVFAEKIDSA